LTSDEKIIAEINSLGPFVHAHYTHPQFGEISQEGPLKGRADLLLESALSTLQGYMDSTNKSREEISILDVGAYDGWILNRLYQLGFRNLTGIEPRKQNIERGIRIRELLGIQDNVKHFQGTLDTLEILNSHRFDLVLCFGVIHHINDINLFVSQLNMLLIEGGRLLLETLCLSDSLITDQFREFMEPKDLIYSGKDVEVGIIGVKLESAYYPESTDVTGTVQIPSERTLKWFLEFNNFSINSFRNGWESIPSRENLFNSHRKNATSCLIDSTKILKENPVRYENSASQIEEIATCGIIDLELLTELEKACDENSNPYNQILASKLEKLKAKSEFPDLISSIIHALETKLRFEIAKYQLATGNIEVGIEILKRIVTEISEDWRTTYRTFYLLAIFDKNSKFDWKEMALRCNPEFPLFGSNFKFNGRFLKS
jgi:SAM-dependent methyltransferase